jgi:DNA-binding SARP family transcriptional activator/tetratricopeptide (TPR) repeat protein
MFELATLGTARLSTASLDGSASERVRIELPPKRFGLLAWLALQSGGACRRDRLLALFWPESDSARARNALSKTLGRLRSALGEDVIRSVGRHEIALAPGAIDSDVHWFRAAMARSEWARVHELYAGEFLDGFHVPDSPGFDEWAAAMRDELRRGAVRAGSALADEQVARGDRDAASETLRRTLRIVPADESVARQLVELLLGTGDRASALEVFAGLEGALREVGASPSVESRRLIATIRGAARVQSIAVLPWANLTGSADQDHVADGFTDLLITEVALTFPSRVIARQSSLQLKGSDLPLRSIGALLHVDAVIEGSIARFGERFTVTAQLLRVDPEEHLWAGRFAAAIEELPAVASTVAGEVTRAISNGIDGSQPPGATAAEPDAASRQSGSVAVDPLRGSFAPFPASVARTHGAGAGSIPADAYDAFLRARHFAGSLSTLDRAVSHYEEVLRLAPDYAPAWAGLASTYGTLTMFAVHSPAELFPPFRRAAERATRLDPGLGEAHSSLGLYHMLADRDWRSAEEALRRGATLSAGQPEPHTHLALYLAAMGRFDQAASECTVALDVDPIGPGTRFCRAWCLYKAGAHAESNAVLDDLLELYPAFVLATTYRALNFALLDRPDDATHHAMLAIEAAPDSTEVLAAAIAAIGRAGRARDAERPLRRLLDTEQSRYVDPWAVGTAFAGLGRHDDALHWFRRMYDERSPSAFCIRRDPLLDPIRRDARFREIERRLGFPVFGRI